MFKCVDPSACIAAIELCALKLCVHSAVRVQLCVHTNVDTANNVAR